MKKMWAVVSGEYDDYDVNALLDDEESANKAVTILNEDCEYVKYRVESIKHISISELRKISIIQAWVRINPNDGSVMGEIRRYIRNVWPFELEIFPLTAYWIYTVNKYANLEVVSVNMALSDKILNMMLERLRNEPELRAIPRAFGTVNDDSESE